MEVEFYCSDAGNNYVGDAIEELPAKAAKKITRVLDRLEKYGAYALMTVTDQCIKLKGYLNLYELRILCEKVWYRIIFTIKKTTCWLLHFFIKKGNKTPEREIKTALARSNVLNLKLGF